MVCEWSSWHLKEEILRFKIPSLERLYNVQQRQLRTKWLLCSTRFFCVREFIKTESATAVQRAFRLRFNIQTQTFKLHFEYNQMWFTSNLSLALILKYRLTKLSPSFWIMLYMSNRIDTIQQAVLTETAYWHCSITFSLQEVTDDYSSHRLFWNVSFLVVIYSFHANLWIYAAMQHGNAQLWPGVADVRFVVLTTVSLTVQVFWEVMLCWWVRGSTFWRTVMHWSLLAVWPWKWRYYVPSQHCPIVVECHSVTANFGTSFIARWDKELFLGPKTSLWFGT